jgi:hypothetical protein
MRIDVNADELVKFTSKLDKINRSALPIAVRSTLNQAAFATKKEIPIQAANNFITRNKGFFRSLTSVNKAGGFDINKMQSEVGINTSKSKVADGISKQELGGTIKDRNLIAMNQSRVSGSKDKKVRKVNNLSNIRISKTRKKGSGTGFVMLKKGTKGTIFQVKKGKKNNLTPLYSYQKGRSVNIKRNPFIEPASIKSQNRMPAMYINEALKQIKKYMK